MQQNFYSVRIIRKHEQAAPAVYLKEFFMFCGIYVREYIPEVTEGDLEEEVDVNISLCEIDPAVCPKARFTYSLSLDSNSMTSIQKRGKVNTKLKKVLALVDSDFEKEGRLINVLSRLLFVFHEMDYAHLNYGRHCFLKQMDSEAQLGMAQKYYECYEKIRSECKNINKDWHEYNYINFARFNCARKVDDICRSRGDLPYFLYEKVMRDAAAMSESDPDYSMGYALAGFIGLAYDHLWSDGKYYMEKALEKENGKRHSAFILYALGHSWEVERRDFAKGWESYDKMRSIAPGHYRAVFKQGCRFLREKDGQNACQCFEKVYRMMKAKETAGFIQPLETEYKYKCEKLLSESSIMCRYTTIPREELLKGIESDLETAFSGSRFSQDFWEKGERKVYAGMFGRKLTGHSYNTIVRPEKEGGGNGKNCN